jgi:WD40 repeat protein
MSFALTNRIRYLITASSDHSVKLWDISTGDCIKQYNGKLLLNLIICVKIFG